MEWDPDTLLTLGRHTLLLVNGLELLWMIQLEKMMAVLVTGDTSIVLLSKESLLASGDWHDILWFLMPIDHLLPSLLTDLLLEPASFDLCLPNERLLSQPSDQVLPLDPCLRLLLVTLLLQKLPLILQEERLWQLLRLQLQLTLNTNQDPWELETESSLTQAKECWQEDFDSWVTQTLLLDIGLELNWTNQWVKMMEVLLANGM